MTLNQLGSWIQKILSKEIRSLIKERKLLVGERVKIQGLITHSGIKVNVIPYKVNKRLVVINKLSMDDLKRITEIPTLIHLTPNQLRLFNFFIGSNNEPIKKGDLWDQDFSLVNSIFSLNKVLKENGLPFAITVFKKGSSVWDSLICFRKVKHI